MRSSSCDESAVGQAVLLPTTPPVLAMQKTNRSPDEAEYNT